MRVPKEEREGGPFFKEASFYLSLRSLTRDVDDSSATAAVKVLLLLLRPVFLARVY